MKNILCAILLTMCFMPTTMLPQEKSLNNYKYVIVPIKFDFITENDQYKLNSLTEFLFEKYGFTAILEGEKFPEDLILNPCSALNAEVHSDSGMFSFLTKVNIVLKNCNQQVVFESKEGKSKLKDREFAYQEALRDAFLSIEALNYSYSAPERTNSGNSEKPVETATITEETENPRTDLILTKDGQTFLLEKQEKGFLLKNETSKNTSAHLYVTSRGNYIYRSQNHNGTAYFDEKGNLVVEYFDGKEEKMKTIIFRR